MRMIKIPLGDLLLLHFVFLLVNDSDIDWLG